METAAIRMERDALRDTAQALGEAEAVLKMSAEKLEILAQEKSAEGKLRRRCRRGAKALRALGAEYHTRRLLLLLCDQERAVVQGRAYLFAKRLKDAGKLI